MKIKIALIMMAVLLLGAIPVMATDITTAEYLTKILMTNNESLTVENCAVTFTCNTSAYITGGMLGVDAKDLVLHSDIGSDTPVMPGWGSNPWVFFDDEVAAGGQEWKFLYTKAPESDQIAYFPASDGMTILDSPTLELRNIFTIEDKVWVDTTKVGDIIFSKPSAITCNVTASGEISVGIDGPGAITLTATGITTGYHIILVTADGFDMRLYIDGILKDTEAMISM